MFFKLTTMAPPSEGDDIDSNLHRIRQMTLLEKTFYESDVYNLS